MPRMQVTWSQTEEFSHVFEVDEDFDATDDEAVEELICNLDTPELDEAFQGCMERTITGRDDA